MGGKKYPKKGSNASEGSSSTQQTSGSSTSGPPIARQGPPIRQVLQQLSVSSGEAQPSTSGQSSRPQQPQQAQQRPQGQGPDQKGGPQKAKQGPKQGKGQQQGGQAQGQQAQRQQGPQPQAPQQQQWRPQTGQQGQAPQQQQWRPQTGQQGQAPQQQQQQWRPQTEQQGQARQQPGQGQVQHGQRQQGQQRQQPRDDRSQQSGLSRAESTTSLQSEKSQGARSTASSGGKPPQKSSPPVLSMEGIQMLNVKYKGAGTKGRKLPPIETNYLRLMMDKLVDNAYHYDVQIELDKPKKLLTKVFLEFVRINFPRASIAFDGMNSAYASAELQIPTNLQREIKIIHPETKRELNYKVEIKAANDSEIPIKRLLTSYQNTPQSADPKRAMQAMEVILKSAFHQDHLKHGIVGGRSFFLPPSGRREYLGDFYELWLGLFQSTVLGEVAFLNVDVNHKAFPKRYASLIDLLKELRRNIPLNLPLDDRTQIALGKHLSGLEICYNVPNAQGIICKFMQIDAPPSGVRFRTEDGQEKTVLQYFQELQRRIQYPNLNCIRLGNNICVPMEFCSIPDKQVVNKKCTENQTRNIIRFAATSTDERKRKIMDLLNQIKHNASPTIKGFGLGVDANFTKVPARLLDAPIIQYDNKKTLKPNRGVWRADNMKFLIPESATTWSILNTNRDTTDIELKNLAHMLYECSKSTGVQLAQSPIDIKKISDEDPQREIQDELDRIGIERKIQIVFVIISDNGQIYADIKKSAEIKSKTGVLTQCIKGTTVFRKRTDGSTISNILLKVNAKLNGTNHKLQSSPILSGSKCMLIGADVTHPSPDQTRIPSVVGVAASHDDNAFCYNICWRLQGQRIEIIQDFKEIMKEHLQFYKKKNGRLPDKILYYRDGVSEGQFDQVMAHERRAMVQACVEVEQGYEKKAKITIVVVQKRHHTRFFPGNTGVGKDDRKNNNVPAGTIVDTVITRPNENHFYLVSHQSIQGVAKPTKYCILLDEGNHNIDDLQGLTYNLCHLFSRCNRSVSYPAPTYYAHLAAYRGRVYIENENLNMNDLDREWRTRAIKENIIKGHPMYFI